MTHLKIILSIILMRFAIRMISLKIRMIILIILIEVDPCYKTSLLLIRRFRAEGGEIVTICELTPDWLASYFTN